MDKVIVFIPMYNCEKQIRRVLKQFNSNIKQYIQEIVIVNNRSTDNGEQIAIEYMKNITDIKITVLKNEKNYGLGGSHKVAIDYGLENKYDYLIVLHGDDQGDIREIEPYLEGEIYKQCDCLLGARFQKGSKLEGYSKFRTFGNKVYNIFFSVVCKKRIYDLGSGLNMYNLKIFKNMFHKRFPDDLTFNYCMVLGSTYYKHKIKFFPLTWREDDQVSNVKMFKQAFKVLGLLGIYGVDKGRFLDKDHREKNIEKYSYSIVHSSDQKKG